jgi:hypothetical protein
VLGEWLGDACLVFDDENPWPHASRLSGTRAVETCHSILLFRTGLEYNSALGRSHLRAGGRPWPARHFTAIVYDVTLTPSP